MCFGHSGGFQAGYRPNAENAFATRPFALLATSIAFYDILARACAEIKILRPTSLGFSIFDFFSRLSSFSLSFLFAAVINLSLGLLAVKNFKESVTETGNFYNGVVRCSGRKFCSEFFTNYLSTQSTSSSNVLCRLTLQKLNQIQAPRG